MSANPEVLRGFEAGTASAAETALPRVDVFRQTSDWDPMDFAHEQIRGLVRRVFLTSGTRVAKHVVFGAAEPGIDLASICDRVGRALALETQAHIAIVGRERGVSEVVRPSPQYVGTHSIKSWSAQIGTNLWHVPELGRREPREEWGTGRYWLSCLVELRHEFEFGVIQGPAAGISSEAAMLGQIADGIILVLGAHSTRKATARKIKETLEGAQSRILGTVLSDRTFPIPERIYRLL